MIVRARRNRQPPDEQRRNTEREGRARPGASAHRHALLHLLRLQAELLAQPVRHLLVLGLDALVAPAEDVMHVALVEALVAVDPDLERALALERGVHKRHDLVARAHSPILHAVRVDDRKQLGVEGFRRQHVVALRFCGGPSPCDERRAGHALLYEGLALAPALDRGAESDRSRLLILILILIRSYSMFI